MEENKQSQEGRLIWVKDKAGNEYVCPLHALKNPDDLTEEEKSRCVDVKGPRGLASPI